VTCGFKTFTKWEGLALGRAGIGGILKNLAAQHIARKASDRPPAAPKLRLTLPLHSATLVLILLVCFVSHSIGFPPG
jgi:hypothetical protein